MVTAEAESVHTLEWVSPSSCGRKGGIKSVKAKIKDETPKQPANQKRDT